jgi:alpha-tubulin suppressor-like RCC1 family protein
MELLDRHGRAGPRWSAWPSATTMPALLRSGAVSCWGSNEFGQLGGSSTADRRTPSAVAGVTGARRGVAGDDHTCALIGGPGTVRCLGDNDNDQTGGQGSRVTSSVAVGGLTGVVELVAGGEHTCGRHAGGTISCWGYNYLGQLGVGSTRPTSTSSAVSARGVGDAVQLAAGRYSTCALRRGGAVSCWGLHRGRARHRRHDRPEQPDRGWDVTSDPNPTPRAVHDLPSS